MIAERHAGDIPNSMGPTSMSPIDARIRLHPITGLKLMVKENVELASKLSRMLKMRNKL